MAIKKREGVLTQQTLKKDESKKKKSVFFELKPKEKKKPSTEENQKSSRLSKRLEVVNQEDKPKKYDRRKLKNFLSIIKFLDVKCINTTLPNAPIELTNNYAKYLQLYEIKGKDLNIISRAERLRITENYREFLEIFVDPITFESTTLLTDTSSQTKEMERVNTIIRKELLDVTLDARKRAQLEDRQMILKQNIFRENRVNENLFNKEYVMWFFSDTIEDLQRQERLIVQASNYDFAPKPMSIEKKKQIIRQFYNQNERY